MVRQSKPTQPGRAPRRRGPGEGTIYQRPDGRWTTQVSAGYKANGKRNRPQLYGDTYEEVRDKRTKLLRRVAEEGAPDPDKERQKLGEYLSWWFSEEATPNMSPASLRQYSIILRRHLIPELGLKVLRKLQPEDVIHYINTKRAQGLSPATLRQHYGLLRRALRVAYRYGRIPNNPMDRTSAPRLRSVERRTLDVQEARAFLDAVKDERLAALYITALALGLRRGEALGLRWADVDFEKRELHIRTTLQMVDGRPSLLGTKTDKSRRTVIMPLVAIAALRAHRKQQLADRIVAGAKWQDSGMVFSDPVGAALRPEYVSLGFAKFLRRKGLPHMRLHDLRHSAASLMLAGGVDLKMVSETLGHASINITADLYIHPTEAQRRSVAEHMNNALGFVPNDHGDNDDEDNDQAPPTQLRKGIS